jgi:hypothetical protein
MRINERETCYEKVCDLPTHFNNLYIQLKTALLNNEFDGLQDQCIEFRNKIFEIEKLILKINEKKS